MIDHEVNTVNTLINTHIPVCSLFPPRSNGYPGIESTERSKMLRIAHATIHTTFQKGIFPNKNMTFENRHKLRSVRRNSDVMLEKLKITADILHQTPWRHAFSNCT